MIVKQRAKREQTHPVCLHTVQKYEKVESVNTQNNYETTSEKRTDKKKFLEKPPVTMIITG